jgi:aminomethyltransferase
MDQKTALHPNHLALGARMVPFAGWDMPVQYSGILAEVKAVRTRAGLFDVSHMGRLYISGRRAADFLDWVLTGSASTLQIGRARYCMICNEAGGVIDDTIFYRLAEDRYLLIPNAGNRIEVMDWFQRWIDQKFTGGCDIDDQTRETALIAVQGPDSPRILDGLGRMNDGRPWSELRLFGWGEGRLQDIGVFLARTGYTGEDGFEMVLPSCDAAAIWDALVGQGLTPCGLGARDLLRLEAALPLHGHEIDQNTSPVEAGLERFVRTEGDYIGAPVLHQQREGGTARRLVGLTLAGRRAPRAEYPILFQGEIIGHITSGGYSPTLDTSIAMGYVLVRYAAAGGMVDVDVRGRTAPARIVPLPFYSRASNSRTSNSRTSNSRTRRPRQS